jgi:hypothetical protein
VIVTWKRDWADDTVDDEVRYAFSDIHQLGWSAATPAPNGVVAPPAGGAYNGMEYDTTGLPLAGHSVVYIAVKPQNSDLFTEIAVPLTGFPVGNGPSVTGASPSGTGVSTGTAVTATFNESVVMAAGNFTLAGPFGAVAGAVSYTDATHTATLTPSAPLAPGTTYTATVSGVKDAAGNTMSAPYTWSFTTAAGSSPPPPGLVAAYNFDEGSGTTVIDDSGNGNNGTISKAKWSTAGKFGGALSFNGTSAQVTIPDSASLRLTTGMTLESWVYPTAVTSAWRTAIYKGVSSSDDYYLQPTSDTTVPVDGVVTNASTAVEKGTSALPVNTWTFLAATYDGASVRLYVNGNQVKSMPETGNILTSSGALLIGDDVWGHYFKGLIDNVRIYNVALSQSAIQTDMNTAVVKAATNAVVAGAPAASASPMTVASSSVSVTSYASQPGTATGSAQGQASGVYLAPVVVDQVLGGDGGQGSLPDPTHRHNGKSIQRGWWLN